MFFYALLAWLWVGQILRKDSCGRMLLEVSYFCLAHISTVEQVSDLPSFGRDRTLQEICFFSIAKISMQIKNQGWNKYKVRQKYQEYYKGKSMGVNMRSVRVIQEAEKYPDFKWQVFPAVMIKNTKVEKTTDSYTYTFRVEHSFMNN